MIANHSKLNGKKQAIKKLQQVIVQWMGGSTKDKGLFWMERMVVLGAERQANNTGKKDTETVTSKLVS